ncbi:taste receptor type 2 member 4-like [Rhinoderma darwinii]|uniref:taste receptor type 2 member 4-like n=1 Tax=Rhinoderma darwinii TaxID=43563 RepID=UPI003F66A388
MWPPVRIVKATILIMTTISGLSINSSLVAEYCRTWSQKHQPGACILISTAVTNVLLQCSVTLDGLLYIFGSHMMFAQGVYVMDFVLVYFLLEVSFWHTTWLSIYYCLKLVNLPNPFFFQLKLRFPSIVPLLLTGSFIGSLLINAPFLWTLQITGFPNETDYRFEMFFPFTMFNVIFGCCFPFLITFTSIVLSVTSLLSHILKVKSDETNFRRPQLKAHIGAVKTMVTRLTLDLILCLVATGLLTSEMTFVIAVDTACWLFLMLYSTLQSIVLILGNPKLKTKLFTCSVIRRH